MFLVSEAHWCHITIWLDLDDLICCSDRLMHSKAAQGKRQFREPKTEAEQIQPGVQFQQKHSTLFMTS